MKRSKYFLISGILLLLSVSNLQAQYVVRKIEGAAEVSTDGKTWSPLKKKVELKEPDQIKMSENSSIHIVYKGWVYSYAGTGTVSVRDIIKKPGRTGWGAKNGNSVKRTAIGAAERKILGTDTCQVCLRFKVVGEPVWYDFKFIPADSVFYLTVFNKTKTGKTVNVYQELENSELIPCLPKDISIEKETAIEFTDILFVKQKDSKFTISYSEKE